MGVDDSDEKDRRDITLACGGVDLSQTDTTVGICDIIEELLGIFANERFLVVASNIMPSDAVVINVVKYRQTGLVGTIDIEFRVIRLPNFLVSSLGPRIEAPARWYLIGWCHFFTICRPEPTVQ